MAAQEAVRIEVSEAERAKVLLPAARGLSNLAITERLGVARMSVATWRRRLAARRPGSGRALHQEIRGGRQ